MLTATAHGFGGTTSDDARRLRIFAEWWRAAAGKWNDNFAIAPNELVRVSGGVVIDFKR